jgi:hypothetical protein
VTKPKVVLRVPTIGHKAGDTIEVESKEQADYLVDNGHAAHPGDVPKTTQSK